jgi:hypothetical protein
MTGEVLDAGIAREIFLRERRKEKYAEVFLFVSLCLGAFVIAAYLDDKPYTQRDFLLFTSIFLGGLVVGSFICVWTYDREKTRWLAPLSERVAALPPAGALVRIDADTLTSGDHRVAWADLRIDLIDLVHWRKHTRFPSASDYRMARLVVQAPGAGITLDADLMQNGTDIAKETFLRLNRASPGFHSDRSDKSSSFV